MITIKQTILIILIGITVFGVLGLYLWNQSRFSSDLVTLEIEAPEEVEGGEEFEYVVVIEHQGNVRLEDVQLIFEYPRGALPEDEGPMRRMLELDDLYPGQRITESFPARIFGAEGDTKEASSVLSYRPRDITPRFQSEASVTTRISSSAMVFDMDLPSRVESGERFTFDVNYLSQSSHELSDVTVRLVYPRGFSFFDATPEFVRQDEWSIDSLSEGNEGTISIDGSLSGDIGEAREFRAEIGLWRDGNFTLLQEATGSVEVSEPRLVVNQFVNGEMDRMVRPGEDLNYLITFRNAGERELEDLSLSVELNGHAFDMDSIQVDGGEFNSQNNTVSWSADDISELESLPVGAVGTVGFSIGTTNEWDAGSGEDRSFSLRTTVRLNELVREFSNTIGGEFRFDQVSMYDSGPFSDSGPVPPRSGDTTTYAVMWEVSNHYSESRDVTARAFLPIGVDMTGSISPAAASITHDPSTSEVVWNIGDMQPGDSDTVYFQVSVTPGFGEAGTNIVLVNQSTVTGIDTFVDQERESTAPAINVQVSSDQ